MKKLKTTDGFEVIVSDEDFNFINWFYDLYIDVHGYVNCKLKPKRARLGQLGGKLHRILMGYPDGGRKIVVDHINGNKLDNSRENLRICTHEENMRNRRKFVEATSQYKGVYWNEQGFWVTRMYQDNVQTHMGSFDDEISAANCYNYHAKRLFGEFASLNECPYLSKEEWESKRRKNNVYSDYRGVSYDKRWNKWLVQIMHKGKSYSERVDTEKQAAKKYNELALKLKGDKAKLNTII